MLPRLGALRRESRVALLSRKLRNNSCREISLGGSFRRGVITSRTPGRDGACDEQRETKMKNRIIITAIGVATLAAITLNAGEVLLSPRAKDNQITVVPRAANEPNLAAANRDRLGSPRALDNQIKVVKGAESVPTTGKGAVIGAPRQPDLVASCCTVAKANCAPARACCAK
jgi:hypothetical protein